MTEIWKDIKEFDGYQVSNLGRVKSFKRYKEGRILSEIPHSLGYLRTRLSKDGGSYTLYTHRLVAEAFVENENNYKEVNHKDLIKKNNKADNLEWVTRSENLKHAVKNTEWVGGCGKFKRKQVLYIRNILSKTTKVIDIARKYKVCDITIYNMLKFRTYKYEKN